MTEKQQQLTFDKGITNVPSDAICSDNALAESIGMVYDNGEHKVIQKPAAFITEAVVQDPVLGNTSPISVTVLYVHRFNDEERYIGYTTSTDGTTTYYDMIWCTKYNSTLFKQDYLKDNGNTLRYTESTKVTSVGKTLVVSDENGMYYYLWKRSNEYNELTLPLPDIKLDATLYVPDMGLFVDNSAKTTGVLTPIAHVEELYNELQINSGEQEAYNNIIVGAYSKNLKTIAQNKMFAEPFFIRAALEMYDGSYTYITNPVLLFPSVTSNTCFFYANGSLVCRTLCSKLYVKQTQDYKEYSDIIKDVVIFASDTVHIYSTSQDQPKPYRINQQTAGNPNGDNPVWNTVASTDDVYTMLSESVYRDNNGFFDPTELSKHLDQQSFNCLLKRNSSDIVKDLESVSVFYKLCSLGISSIDNYVDIAEKTSQYVVENITTQEQLGEDDYYSRCKIIPNVLYAYNSRINVANAVRGVFNGFDFFTPLDKQPTDARFYDFYVKLELDTEEVWVKHTNYLSRVQGFYFYYPDSRATHVTIYRADGNGQSTCVCAQDLKEHPYLNGAYYLRGLPNSTGEISVQPGEKDFIPGHDVYNNNKTEGLYNYILTSEANNPFVFKAQGYYKVGTGKILGMSSITQALSEGQFGQYPLLVFSESGIWALSVASTGYYDSIHPMSREVCNNPQSITQTDGAVFFTSDKGLMVVVGSQVKCVSEQLSGRRDLFAESQLQGINLINNYHSFFKNCFIAYDYRDSLLWIYKKNHPACLIYSIKNGTFSKSSFLMVQNVINYYPDCLLQDNSKKVYSLLQRPAITDDTSKGYGAMLFTRPMKFENGLALKSLLDIRSIRRVNGKMTLRVFASNNLDDWVELTSLRGTPWLYYRFRYDFKNMKAVDRFAGSVVITQERRTNKLRTPGSIIEQEGSDYTYYIRTNWDNGIQIPQDQSVLTILFDAFFTRKAAGADEEEPAVVKYKIWKVSQSETFEELYSGEDTEATSKPIEVAYSETPASNTSKIVIAINIEQDPTPSSYLAMAQVNVTKIPDTPTVYTYMVAPSPSSIVIPYGETEIEAIVRGYSKRSADGGEPEDFPAYFRVWKRSGDTYTQIGQSPSAGYSYGVDDFFDTNDDAVVISIFKETPSDDPGDILASAIIPITEEPAPPEPPTPPTPTEDFDTLLDGFNDVLESCGFSRITQSSAPNTYAYLESGYDMAIDEWEDADSDLFKTTTYPELYDGTDYRGSNTDYNGVAKNSMTSWLMAMQLAELVPSSAASGVFTNNQTEIFKYAYNCVDPNGNGKTIPLYGGFDIHSDPMIARLAAGAVYQNVRGAKTFAQIDTLRQEVYGDSGDHWIDAYDWDGLGYTYYDDRDVAPNVLGETARLTYQSGMAGLGYAVNTDAFLPGAPGPFAKDDSSDWAGLLTQTPSHLVDKKTGATTPAGQPDALFNSTTKNYLVDEHIDAFMVQNYNLGKAMPSSEWNDTDYTDAMKNVVIDAAAADRCSDRYFYGDRIDVECIITTQVVDSTTQYIYSFAEGGLGNLYIEGPLSLLKDVYQHGDTLDQGGYTTAPGVIHTFLSDVMEMFDNSRFPTFHDRFGRRRPCVGETRYCPRVWTGVINNSYSKQNGIYSPTLSGLVADTAAQASGWANDDELVTEQPKSYPSGHSAQAWGMSMLIGQILPDRIAELMAKAYKVGVGRTVSRYHWNSDAIYGRLFATMMMPLVNAMNGTNPNNGETFQDSYDTLKTVLSVGGDINISVTISNTTGSAITLNGQLVFVLVNPDRNGVYHGWHGVYNRTDRISFSSQAVTIQPGDSMTFTNVFCEGIGGRSLLPGERMGETDYATNVLLYDTNGVSSTIIPNNMSSSFYFEDGGSYAITITGYNPNP